jgi:hypothetical protein
VREEARLARPTLSVAEERHKRRAPQLTDSTIADDRKSSLWKFRNNDDICEIALASLLAPPRAWGAAGRVGGGRSWVAFIAVVTGLVPVIPLRDAVPLDVRFTEVVPSQAGLPGQARQ